MRRAVEAAVQIPAPAEAVFARLDDQTWLAARMERSSAMMGGSSFGLSLYVNEVVTVRDPPRRRAWKTVGAPRLLVVGAYEITPPSTGSNLRVWLTYDLALGLLEKALGPILAPLYAKWCVGRMAGDAADDFGQPGLISSPATKEELHVVDR